MPSSSEQTREALLAELEIHKAEFSVLQEKVIHWDESERQFVNWSILAVGAGLGISQFVISPQAQIVLLLFPLVFHVFFREMLDCTRHVTDASVYLMETLIPKINQILDQLEGENKRYPALEWEYQTASEPFNLLLFIIQPMRYWIPVSAIIALLLLYAANAITNNYQVPVGHLALIVVNILYLVAAMVWGVRFYQKVKRRAAQLQGQLEHTKAEIAAKQKHKAEH